MVNYTTEYELCNGIETLDNDDFWESQKWKKLDICTHCLNEMSMYIKTKGRGAE